ncbi:PLDc N-terminal domain-containing protein [Nocardia niigatensis]|uniref:PLDc N-terminal domain-containing protein n=1 Tax=Nocardia niigatensis TaxID=209249 RepID=UPI00030A922C|nr:PLDc N-terminal domain-containing protein [Nocardia niigatensis]
MSNIPVAALVPLIVVGLGFVGFCWYDLYRTQVKYLPKWAWAIICLISIPLGGIIYLIVGRDGEQVRG